MNMKIVILDGYTVSPDGLAWRPLEQLGALTVYDRTLPEETIGRVGDAEIVLTNKVCLRKAELEQLPKLRYIGVLATGYNVVDVGAAKAHGIVVTNVPVYSTESVAQMVFAHLLTVTNRTEHYATQNRHGKWTKGPDFCYWDTPLSELAGKTFGVVGLGNIGKRVAGIAQAFGMRVVAYTSKEEADLPPGIGKRPMEDLLDVLSSLNVFYGRTDGSFDPNEKITRAEFATAATRFAKAIQGKAVFSDVPEGYWAYETLQKVKPSAILINTGRGPLVNEQDVADALRNDRLRAYCADVLSEEPPRAECPLLSCGNAFITPHIAWATDEARARLAGVAVDNVRAFVEGEPKNIVG